MLVVLLYGVQGSSQNPTVWRRDGFCDEPNPRVSRSAYAPMTGTMHALFLRERPMNNHPPQHPEPPQRRGRVLLAEDDAELRRLLREALQAAGYDVVEVADGGRLLVRLGQEYRAGRPEDSFDVMISDVRMPVCTGLQIVESLRVASRRFPVILITAFADDATRAKAERLGAVLLDKPFDVDELVKAVERTVSVGRPRGGA